MSELKGIIKRKKTINYSVISNQCFRNKELSLKAMGLFAYLMTLPETWQVHQSELVRHFKDGRDSIASAMKELEKHGYIIKTKERNDKGQILGTIYTVIEEPCGKPETENPNTDKPNTENPTLLSTDNKVNTNTVSTNITPDKSGEAKILYQKTKEFTDFITNSTKMKLTKKEYFSCREIIKSLNNNSQLAMKLYEWACKDGFWGNCVSMPSFCKNLRGIKNQYDKTQSEKMPDHLSIESLYGIKE